MKLNKIVTVLGILVLASVILLIAAPKNVVIEREIVINRPVANVFAYVRSLKNQDVYNPWFEQDPQVVREHLGPDGEVGNILKWKGNKDVGVGEQEILSIRENERIDSQLRFKEPMQDINPGWLVTEALGDQQTRLKWGMRSELRTGVNVIYLLLNIKGTIEKDFDRGLAKIKTELEK